jgi:hypothetical protein
MWLDNDRMSHWFAGAMLSWTGVFLLLGLLVFHLWLKVPVAKIASFTGICCVVQLAVTPWLFHARSTPQNPPGRIRERVIALSVLFSAVSLLFFYYLRRSAPEDIETLQFTTIALIGTIPVVALSSVIAYRIVRKR